MWRIPIGRPDFRHTLPYPKRKLKKFPVCYLIKWHTQARDGHSMGCAGRLDALAGILRRRLFWFGRKGRCLVGNHLPGRAPPPVLLESKKRTAL